jgi:hypothetical protein
VRCGEWTETRIIRPTTRAAAQGAEPVAQWGLVREAEAVARASRQRPSMRWAAASVRPVVRPLSKSDAISDRRGGRDPLVPAVERRR